MQRMEPERLFSFTWHPYAVDPNEDYSKEPPTLVEFTLQPIAGGTLLRVVESGFDKLPARRRNEAFRMNDGGWSEQMEEHCASMSDTRRSSLAELQNRALVFAALGDETRLSVLARLSLGEPQSISRLTDGTGLTRQAVTKHLRVLQAAGVVRGLRAGRESLFVLDAGPARRGARLSRSGLAAMGRRAGAAQGARRGLITAVLTGVVACVDQFAMRPRACNRARPASVATT